MEKFKQSEYFPIFLLAIIFIVCIPVFWLHQGLLTIDIGRELYIPSKMLSGELLYRDILNIYGPLAYQINALLFKIFGERIETLYSFGLFNSFVIVCSIFLISREFFDKTISFLFGLLTITVPVFTPYLFNTNFPYSYSFVYSFSSFLFAVLFLIRYEKTKDIKYFYLSSLFTGFSSASKLEFTPFLLLLIIEAVKNKISVKQTFMNLACLCIVPFISFSLLLFQGVTISDFQNTINLLHTFSSSKSFKIFYLDGLTLKSVVIRFISLICIGICFLILFFREKLSKVWQKIPLEFIFLIFTYVCISLNLLFYALPLLIIILMIIFREKLKNNFALLLLLASIIISGAKGMFYLDGAHFGGFLVPLFILALTLLFNEEKYKPCILLILISLIVIFANNDISGRNAKNFLIETPKGSIYTYTREGQAIKELSEFVKENIKKEDKMLISPESAFVNFAYSVPSNSKLYSLIPLYVDMLGEENIINELNKDRPKYIIISKLDTIEFGSASFCGSYAKKVCGYIYENYEFVKSTDGTAIDLKMNIYERKE